MSEWLLFLEQEPLDRPLAFESQPTLGEMNTLVAELTAHQSGNLPGCEILVDFDFGLSFNRDDYYLEHF